MVPRGSNETRDSNGAEWYSMMVLHMDGIYSWDEAYRIRFGWKDTFALAFVRRFVVSISRHRSQREVKQQIVQYSACN